MEGEQYVTSSLVIPIIAELRAGLVMLQQQDTTAAAAGSIKNQRRLILVTDLLNDFNNRWGDGTNICTESEGPRRQPQAFSHSHVLATALDPRTRDLKGVPIGEHSEVWRLVERYLAYMIQADRAEQKKQIQSDGDAAEPESRQALAEDDPGYDSSEEIQARMQKQVQMACLAETSQKPWEDLNQSPDDVAAACVRKYRQWRSGGVIDMSRDPLTGCWRHHVEADDWGPLAQLAKRVLATPASSAPVERIFSKASHIVSKHRHNLTHENVSLLLFLQSGWDKAREISLHNSNKANNKGSSSKHLHRT